MDKFLEWIRNNQEHRALIDKSHKNVSTREKNAPLKEYDNTELATYGDAVLKLALCQILWKNEKEFLTEEKKKYESDEVLVKVIARHYDILHHLHFDKVDKNKPQDYDYRKNGYKYIATAIEACLGAMHIDKNVSWNDIIEIVKEWKNLIDDSI